MSDYCRNKVRTNVTLLSYIKWLALRPLKHADLKSWVISVAKTKGYKILLRYILIGGAIVAEYVNLFARFSGYTLYVTLYFDAICHILLPFCHFFCHTLMPHFCHTLMQLLTFCEIFLRGFFLLTSMHYLLQILRESFCFLFKHYFPDDPKMEALANFALVMNNWFDSSNSNGKLYPDKPLKNPLGGEFYEQQKQALLDGIAAVEKLRFRIPRTKTLRKTRLPWQDGLIIWSRSLMGLFEYLQEKYGIETLNAK